MADYNPVFEDGQFTLTASAAITEGQLVTASGDNTCAPSAAGDHSVGVAAFAAASGAKVTIWPLGGVVHETTITGVVAIAAGAPIKAAAAGAVDTGTLATLAAAGTFLGICIKGGTGGSGTPKAQWIGA
jgi:hypothetical protein